MFNFFATLWTVVHQVPLSMGFSRQEHWSGLPCPPPGHLPNPGMDPHLLTSPALAGGLFTTSAAWEACWMGFTVFRLVWPSSLPYWLQNMVIAPKRNPLPVSSPASLLQPPASTRPLPVSLDLSLLDIPHERDLWCLASVTQRHVFKACPCCIHIVAYVGSSSLCVTA